MMKENQENNKLMAGLSDAIVLKFYFFIQINIVFILIYYFL